MEALFIGQTYIDVTLIADEMPKGDEKAVAKDYAVSFGGNALTAAFACAKLGYVPDLLTSLADDWLGRMFLDMAAKYQIPIHARKVKRSSLSFILPREGKRAILRARDDAYLHPFPTLNLDGCRALHLDGHQADAAIHYARLCREMGVLTSLDGGGLRSNTHELLGLIDIAIVAERLCEQMNLDDRAMLAYLKARGITVIYVSHRMEEIFRLCDAITVLRDCCFDTDTETHNMLMDKIFARPATVTTSAEFVKSAKG